jgi:hypothetical protein
LTIFTQLFNAMRHNRIPGQMIVQITDSCNARCPQCGMRTSASFDRSTLSRDMIKRTIDAAAGQGVQAISFTGGEPLLDMDRLVELIDYADSAGIPYIRTGTNGFMFRRPDHPDFHDRVSRVVDALSATGLRNFWISLDSAVDHVHEQMRGFPGAVSGIAKALPVFHRAGIYPAVNLGLNRNVGGHATRNLSRISVVSDDLYLRQFYMRYRTAFKRFFQKAVDLGFTMANVCYPMSIDVPETEQGLNAVYAATTVDDIVRFSADEKRMLFAALKTVISQFRSKIRIFTPLCSVEALIRQYDKGHMTKRTYGCRGGVDFFFVNAADGHIYPCGYRGNENFGPLEGMAIRQLVPPLDADACRQCDWECFRDPSELFGPLLTVANSPLTFIRQAISQPKWLATWLQDLLYYRACGFFDGRRSPNLHRLQRFSPSNNLLERKPNADRPPRPFEAFKKTFRVVFEENRLP